MFAQIGSYSYDMNRMLFDVSTLGYIQQSQSITLDYKVAKTVHNIQGVSFYLDSGFFELLCDPKTGHNNLLGQKSTPMVIISQQAYS